MLSTAIKEIDTFEKGHSREVKLTDQILKIVKRVTEKLTRQQFDIKEMQFGFKPGRGNTDATFTLRKLQEKKVAKRNDFYLAFTDLEKAFNQDPRDVAC